MEPLDISKQTSDILKSLKERFPEKFWLPGIQS